MSVTLNCANCRKAIKETSNPSEIQKITGEEICEECGEEISAKRLEARPVTSLCIECKKKQENEEKLRGV